MRRSFILAALAAALAAPASAAAAPGIKYGIQDDAWLHSTPLESRLKTLDLLGPDLVRFTLRWDQVARKKPARATNPNDKAYDWRGSDAILRGLRQHHVAVLVTLLGSPRWANGHRGPNAVPRSKWTFASFAVAFIRPCTSPTRSSGNTSERIRSNSDSAAFTSNEAESSTRGQTMNACRPFFISSANI